MFMEPKGPDGQQAVSFTRLLGIILFVTCFWVWTFSPVEDVPDGLLYTLWGLLGIKGAKDVAIGLQRDGNDR